MIDIYYFTYDDISLIHPQSKILNSEGKVVYTLKNNSTNTLLNFKIFDNDDNCLIEVFEKFSMISPIYNLKDKNGMIFAKIQKDFDISRNNIKVDTVQKIDFLIKYTLDTATSIAYKNGEVIAKLNREIIDNKRHFVLEVEEEENPTFYIALAALYLKSFNNYHEVPLSVIL